MKVSLVFAFERLLASLLGILFLLLTLFSWRETNFSARRDYFFSRDAPALNEIETLPSPAVFRTPPHMGFSFLSSLATNFRPFTFLDALPEPCLVANIPFLWFFQDKRASPPPIPRGELISSCFLFPRCRQTGLSLLRKPSLSVLSSSKCDPVPFPPTSPQSTSPLLKLAKILF